jgi:hypothetical protein
MAVKPDRSLCRDQLQALQSMLKAWGVPIFVSAMFWILQKQDDLQSVNAQPTRLVPFVLNPIQRHLYDNLALNNLLLKARQIGGTTFFLLVRGLLNTITNEGTNSMLISQKADAAQTHFLMANRAYRMFGVKDPHDPTANDVNRSFIENLLHTKFNNKRELYFDMLESRLTVESAEVEEAGQGPTIHHLIGSEYSRWPGDPAATLANARGALAKGGTVDLECTANGAVGSFYEKYSLAMNSPDLSDARAHFYPWYWADDYRLDLTSLQSQELKADLQEDERKAIEAFHLDLHQVAWRRQAKKEFPGVEFDEKYPESWITAFVVSGKSYFDRDILVARRMELVNFKPFKSFHEGQAKFFFQRIPGRRYVIGADTASGQSISENETDNCAAVVLDLDTGEEVAAYCSKVRPEEFAYDLADLGRYYNDAPIMVERNQDGGTVILVLSGECRYSGVMKSKEWLKRERKIVEFDGFQTNVRTRPIALNFLNRSVKDTPNLLWDIDFISEALVFVRNKTGKPEATSGAHDDRVMCRAIAHAARAMLLNYYPLEGSEKYLSADRM